MFAQVAGLLSRVELRRRARSYLVGLLAPVERKNSWQLAEAMIGRALAAGVEAGWVAADSAYGRDGKFRAFLEARRMSYVA